MSEINNVIMDGFVLLDDYETHNILESDSNELNATSDNKLNLNESISDTENVDAAYRKDYDFGSIILDSIKNANIENQKNVIESDCTSPISIENIELDHESNENVKNDTSILGNYPITMIECPSDTLNIDTSKYQTENINFEFKTDGKCKSKNLTKNLIKEESTLSSKLNEINLQKNFTNEIEENENKCKINIESNSMDMILDNNKYNDVDVMLEKSKVSIQGDELNLKVNGIDAKNFEDNFSMNFGFQNNINEIEKEIIKINEDSLVLTKDIETTDVDLNRIRDIEEILDKDLNSVPNEIELPVKVDEPDFRVNIIERNDSKDVWSTNLYVHKDFADKELLLNKLIDIDLNMMRDNEANSNDSNPLLHDNELPIKVDEPDFRVNIIKRIDSEDTLSTNLGVHNDYTDRKLSSNVEVIEIEVDNSYVGNLNLNEITSSTINSYNNNIKYMTDVVFDVVDFNNEESNSSLKVEIENKINSEENNAENASNINVNHTEKNMNENKLSNNLSEYYNGCPLSLDIGNNSENNRRNEDGNVVPTSQGDLNIKNVDQSEIYINETGLSQIENNETSEKICTIEDNDVKIIHTVEKLTKSVIIRPIGIKNSSKFIGMTVVIEMLFNCLEFRCNMIDYHNSDQIAYFYSESRPDVISKDILFINDLCQLFVVMAGNNEDKIIEVAKLIRRYFRNEHFQLDVYNGFNYLLKTINSITKTVSVETNDLIEKDDISFFNYKCQNQGFVTDLICGQIKLITLCENCQNIHNEKYEQINSLLLKIPKEKTNLNLEDCIKNFFSEVKTEITKEHSCCDNPTIKIIREFTHTPEYLFICVDRTLENGDRDHTYIETDNGVIVETKKGLVLYSLCSVIDQMVVNQSFYNNIKCLSNVWWMIDDRRFRQIQEFEVVSEYSIGFMFKKQNDN